MSVFDVFAECVPEIAFDVCVTCCACLVDVDFPANAAGVGAFAGDATERIIKVRHAEEHGWGERGGRLELLVTRT
jgi:hypothetical protein